MVIMMRNRLRAVAACLIAAFGVLCFSLPRAVADDLEGLDLPTYRDRDGYGLGVTSYSFQTDANLLEGEDPEHAIELAGLLQPPKGEDVLCFSSTMFVRSAQGSRGRDLLLPNRKRKDDKKFFALVPSLTYKDKRGEPLLVCLSEVDSVALARPGTEVEALAVVATAVIVKKRETQAISAEVANRYNDIGLGTSVQVSSIEVDRKNEMTVTLSVKHSGNKDLPVIDSVYALDRRGKKLGGGRWANELELFSKRYDIELVFPVQGDETTIDQFQIVLATKYDVEEIEFTVEDLLTR